jgi:hypothetical protein
MTQSQDLLTRGSQQHAHYEQDHQCEQQQHMQTGDGLAPLLLVTTVDIGDGKSDRIEVRQGDVPLEVANAFVTKHGLPTAVVPRLAMHLEENLLKVEAQRRAAVSKQRQTGTEQPMHALVGSDTCCGCFGAFKTATKQHSSFAFGTIEACRSPGLTRTCRVHVS